MAGICRRSLACVIKKSASQSEWNYWKLFSFTCFSTTIDKQCVNSSSDRITGSIRLMAAIDEGNIESVKDMLTAAAARRFPLDGRDKRGDTVLHHAARSSNERISQLFGELDEKILGGSLNAVNDDGKTPFQLAVDENKLVCALGLMAAGVDTDSSLRYAISVDSVDLVKMSIAFGANVNHTYKGDKPLKTAQQSRGSNRAEILQILHRVGASLEDQRTLASPRDLSSLTCDLDSDVERHNTDKRSSRVLCLDGGGIRGLVLIQLLIAIEKAAGKPLRSCFDFISGTSTGGILALAILVGKSMRFCRSAYLRLKDEVFHGGPPYEPTELESFLKEIFGEKTVMSQCLHPRVMVTSVLADRWPTELHLFRNYPGPRGGDVGDESQPQQPWPEQLVWKAARSTSAAPFYFPLFENRFLDGGVIANNPTVDTLTEIQQLGGTSAASGSDRLTQTTQVVVSLGTGHYRSSEFEGCSIHKWKHVGDIVRDVIGVVDIFKVLAEQSLAADGRVVERAAAWCSSLDLPFFRLNPELSEHVQLNCTDNMKLVNMLYETQCYISDNKHTITKLARDLRAKH